MYQYELLFSSAVTMILMVKGPGIAKMHQVNLGESQWSDQKKRFSGDMGLDSSRYKTLILLCEVKILFRLAKYGVQSVLTVTC